MENVGEHKNLGVSVVGNLTNKKRPETTKKKAKTKRVTKKKLEAGTVNNSIRTAKLEYLRHHTKTVGVMNSRGEYELKPAKRCKEGDVVWVMEDDGTFTKTKIY